MIAEFCKLFFRCSSLFVAVPFSLQVIVAEAPNDAVARLHFVAVARCHRRAHPHCDDCRWPHSQHHRVRRVSRICAAAGGNSNRSAPPLDLRS